MAVRSSATAEDLPDASFAGQQETYLNIRGEEELLEACRRCFASLFTNRAISYRHDQGFDHFDVALSIGVQKMVRSDKGAAGVMFTLDTESGFPDVVLINAAWGLGENVVSGAVNPDEFYVFKPTLKEGFRPILGKHLGSKEKKVVYTEEGTQSATREVQVSAEDRRRFCLDRRGHPGAGPAGMRDRGPLRPAHGHRVGQGRGDGRALHRSGPSRDGPVRRGSETSSRPTGSRRRGRCWPKARASAAKSAPAGR